MRAWGCIPEEDSHFRRTLRRPMPIVCAGWSPFMRAGSCLRRNQARPALALVLVVPCPYWQTKPTHVAPSLQLAEVRQRLPGAEGGQVPTAGSHALPQQSSPEAHGSGATPQVGGSAHTPPLHCRPPPQGVRSGCPTQDATGPSVQTPRVQVWPCPQTLPHVPQLLKSVCGSMHAPLHLSLPLHFRRLASIPGTVSPLSAATPAARVATTVRRVGVRGVPKARITVAKRVGSIRSSSTVARSPGGAGQCSGPTAHQGPCRA